MKKVTEAFLVSGRRTPVGRYGGALSGVRPDDLAAHVVRSVVTEAGIDPGLVDDVILGNANGAGEENRNVARMAWLLAGFDDSVPGMTVNRLCASGMSALTLAGQMIAAGSADIVVAGGVESMSRAPWVMAKPTKPFAGPGEVFDSAIGWRFVNPEHLRHPKRTYSMPETAEEVARLDGITRQEADEFALRSHQRALRAVEEGRLQQEISPVQVKGRRGAVSLVEHDEGPRADTTVELLEKLRPVVDGGAVVTAGNASPLSDGASAVVVASEKAVEKYGLAPRARMVASAYAGVAPEVMGIGPVPATEKALAAAGWSQSDVDVVELNEAFASQSLACIRRLSLDESIVNADGGAIALGHPLGSSGSRIVLTMLRRLEENNHTRGLATMCVGVGQGSALLVEKV